MNGEWVPIRTVRLLPCSSLIFLYPHLFLQEHHHSVPRIVYALTPTTLLTTPLFYSPGQASGPNASVLFDPSTYSIDVTYTLTDQGRRRYEDQRYAGRMKAVRCIQALLFTVLGLTLGGLLVYFAMLWNA